jgi:small subunit ribosomal protein S1
MSNNVKIGQEPEKNEKKLQEEQKERNRVIDLTNNNEKSQPDLPSTALSSDPATEEQDKGNIREKDSESDVKNKKKQEESAPAPFHEQIEKNTKEEKQSPELEIPKEAQIEMYEETMKTVHKGNIVEGTIMKIDSNEVFVDIGFKAEGVIPLSEFDNVEELREGDKVEVFIIRKEDRQGRPRLSKRYADVKRLWDEIEEAYKTGEYVSGKIVERVKGGLMVDIRGIKAFLPASHASTKVLPNLDYFVGKEDEFKIVKLDRASKNVVVSLREVIEEQLSQKKKALLERLEEGMETEGVVKNIMDYGVFIDLGGIDGLLYISDMSWGHLDHPSQMLNLGDRVKVKVLSFDKENEKIALGIKQLVPHPWKNIEIKYPEGSKVTGKVINITPYGAFVELEKGVEGLIHVSEMSWTHHIMHPDKILKVGDTVDAIVLNVDKEQHRISLGLKQIEPNPWLTIDMRYPVGSKVTGKIKNITPFGAFIEIEKDIDGLIHVSDLSWIKRISHPGEMLKIGEEVTAVVLAIDKVKQRISLGIKQLQPDPWESIEEKFPMNSQHTVIIATLIPKGAIVETEEGIEGFIPVSHLGIPGLTEPELAFEKGERIPTKVIEVDKENRRLVFSVKTYFFGREEKEINEFVQVHLEKLHLRRKKRTQEKIESEPEEL